MGAKVLIFCRSAHRYRNFRKTKCNHGIYEQQGDEYFDFKNFDASIFIFKRNRSECLRGGVAVSGSR